MKCVLAEIEYNIFFPVITSDTKIQVLQMADQLSYECIFSWMISSYFVDCTFFPI